MKTKNKPSKAWLRKLEKSIMATRIRAVENQVEEIYKGFRAAVPLTDFNQTEMADWPTYSQQQLVFFEREINRWKNNETKPTFAVCAFTPGAPLSPLIFLSPAMAEKLLNDARINIEHTKAVTPILQELQAIKRELMGK